MCADMGRWENFMPDCFLSSYKPFLGPPQVIGLGASKELWEVKGSMNLCALESNP